MAASTMHTFNIEPYEKINKNYFLSEATKLMKPKLSIIIIRWTFTKYQLFVSIGNPSLIVTKTANLITYDITEILLMLALNTNQSINA